MSERGGGREGGRKRERVAERERDRKRDRVRKRQGLPLSFIRANEIGSRWK